MIKILKLFSFSILTLLLIIPSLEAQAASSKGTIVWDVQWASTKGGRTTSATFWQVDDFGKEYRAVWLANPPVTGNIQMDVTLTSFRGITYNQSNGDTCVLEGIIRGPLASGHYFCHGGDIGVLSGKITKGSPVSK